MQILLETYNRLLAQKTPSYMRRFYNDFSMPQQAVGVIGSRGVGKTTFLLEYLRRHYTGSNKGLYVSADHLYFSEHTLLGMADQFVKEYNGSLLCIDEIHKYKNWNQELKNIIDSYPQLKIIFSGSSSLELMKGQYDLSRRVHLQTMFGFSFREYLEIETKSQFPLITVEQVLQESGNLSKELMNTPRLLGYLKEYLQRGYYPTYLEIADLKSFQQSLIQILDKIIFEDMGVYYSLKTDNIDSLKKMAYFFATSAPGSVNTNRLAHSLGKDHTTIAGYIQMLRDTGLLRFLLIDKLGHALVRNAEKIYLDNTNLLYAINDAISKPENTGLVRETFVISTLQNAGHIVSYSKTGDFEVGGSLLEIGGKNKKRTQIEHSENGFIVADDILYPPARTIPMYLFGFLQ